VRLRTSDDARAALKLQEALGVEVHREGDGGGGELLLEVPNGEQAVPRIVRVLADTKEPLEVLTIGVRRPTLEDVFVKLTGHAIREEEADARDVMRQHGRLWRRARTR
jgi:ABC-2 type transport system ATP-binding protein